jgi:hypothetical protein
VLAVKGTYYNGKVKLYQDVNVNQPIEVILTFLENDNNELKKEISDTKRFDASKYCGIVKFSENPLVLQKRLRYEWDEKLS